MTKGDMFEAEDDRLKCMCQITQSLATAIPPMHGFQMPIIHLPSQPHSHPFTGLDQPALKRDFNQIEDLVRLFNKQIQVKSQTIMTRFKADIAVVEAGVLAMTEEQQ